MRTMKAGLVQLSEATFCLLPPINFIAFDFQARRSTWISAIASLPNRVSLRLACVAEHHVPGVWMSSAA